MNVTYRQIKGKVEQGYGVNRWADAHSINASLKELTKKDIYGVDKETYQDIVDNYFDKKCAKSKQITTEAKQYIPGGVQHNLAFNMPFPMCMVKAEGAYLYDLDGNKYFDFLQAGGPTILGSNYKAVQQLAADFRQAMGSITCGELLGLSSPEHTPMPQERTPEYYRKRPCRDIVGQSSRIFGQFLEKKHRNERQSPREDIVGDCANGAGRH